ncbi:DUF4865 family protein [Klebsiella sp. BIGb0407]|uniref:DUF4865 family protein n=1 Tax=Klebsiella sp. BIGb0407 TaxID=2940603 RepID=UPI00216A8CEF|nr:DUF4865 family protein [Klebsiella sp. BIGb0407]MCS3432405.1 hypothetical protein [Klebsiella sp. BIGb0407]
MIIMQYCFTLPADYDMSIIEQRIQGNGNKLDGFPGLLLKAFLFSRTDDISLGTKENRYAPLYVWKNTEAMTRFLQSPGFVRLTQDFGWPQIKTWQALRTPQVEEIRNKPFLAITRRQILPHSSLTALNLNGQLCGWDVCLWQLLDVTFLEAPRQGEDNYRIGNLAAEENLHPGSKI